MISSLYIHYPYCIHLCNYCDFYKHKWESADQNKAYLDLLTQQLHELHQIIDQKEESLAPLESLYVGGGTPSLLGPDYLEKFLQLLDRYNISRSSGCEFTIEADPGTFNAEDVKRWKELGVNRVSVGVQAFEKSQLNLLDRRHSIEDISESLHLLKGMNFSVDLMIGTPDSHERNIEHEIFELLKFGPSHFSVYILSTRKNYPHNHKLPDDEIIRDQYLRVSQCLIEAGFMHYEVSNFAKAPELRSRHNMKYWDFESVAAVGPNASGTVCRADQVYRYQWKSLSAGHLDEVVEGSSLLIEQLFLGLRRSKEFDLAALFSKKYHEILESKLENWLRLGYVFADSKINKIKVRPLGFLMNDSMLSDLMEIID